MAWGACRLSQNDKETVLKKCAEVRKLLKQHGYRQEHYGELVNGRSILLYHRGVSDTAENRIELSDVVTYLNNVLTVNNVKAILTTARSPTYRRTQLNVAVRVTI